MMPLTLANVGEEYVVRKVGGLPETKKHLENLGFTPGGNVKIISTIGGKSNCSGEGSQNCHQLGDGTENNGIEIWRCSDMKTLKEARIGETVTVVKLHGEGAIKRRIMDMGITKGVSVYVRKVAPLGDPVEISVRGYELSLRKMDAEMVEVE